MGGWLVTLGLAVVVAGVAEVSALLERLRTGTPAERRTAVERLGEVGDASATGDLQQALYDADPGVRAGAQAALWAIWHRSGDPDVDLLLRHGIAQMELGRFPEAVATFSEIISRVPEFAEGWNKRATVYYLMGDYDRSLADCDEVVRRNPIHYGALAGYGLNYLGKGDLERAAQAFERALAVNPNLEGIVKLLGEVRELIRQRARQLI